jgi:hypothetical protein
MSMRLKSQAGSCDEPRSYRLPSLKLVQFPMKNNTETNSKRVNKSQKRHQNPGNDPDDALATFVHALHNILSLYIRQGIVRPIFAPPCASLLVWHSSRCRYAAVRRHSTTLTGSLN